MLLGAKDQTENISQGDDGQGLEVLLVVSDENLVNLGGSEAGNDVGESGRGEDGNCGRLVISVVLDFFLAKVSEEIDQGRLQSNVRLDQVELEIRRRGVGDKLALLVDDGKARELLLTHDTESIEGTAIRAGASDGASTKVQIINRLGALSLELVSLRVEERNDGGLGDDVDDLTLVIHNGHTTEDTLGENLDNFKERSACLDGLEGVTL